MQQIGTTIPGGQPEPGTGRGARVVLRLSYWLGCAMSLHGEEWADAVDLRGYCRLALFEAGPLRGAALDGAEIELAARVLLSYRCAGFHAARSDEGNIGSREGDALYYLPALRQVVRSLRRCPAAMDGRWAAVPADEPDI